MRSIPTAPMRRRNGHQILPVIYVQPQSRTQRLLPLLIFATCGVWIFAMGALLERLPEGQSLPYMSMHLGGSTATASSTAFTSTAASTSGGSSFMGENNYKIPIKNDVDRVQSNNTPPKSPAISKKSEPSKETSLSSKAKNDSNNAQPIIAAGHQIPNVLIFTHSINLLTYEPPPKSKIDDNHNATNNVAAADLEQLLALKENIQHTIEMHPNAKVRFLTDLDCIRSLQAVLGPNAPLIKHFQQETTGMYKADICRGAALWETGGIYLDADVGVRMPLFDVLQANTSFATSLVHKDSNHLGKFFQAFMASTPGHAILERYLHLFLEHYEGTSIRPIKKGPLGVILLRQAFDDVILGQSSEVKTINLVSIQDVENKDKYFRLGPQLLDTTNYGRIQIWQEIQYHPKIMSNVVPAPSWGTRRACHFVVVANKKFPLTVPLYSRIEGSRICRKTVHDEPKESKSNSVPQKVTPTLEGSKTADQHEILSTA